MPPAPSKVIPTNPRLTDEIATALDDVGHYTVRGFGTFHVSTRRAPDGTRVRVPVFRPSVDPRVPAPWWHWLFGIPGEPWATVLEAIRRGDAVEVDGVGVFSIREQPAAALALDPEIFVWVLRSSSELRTALKGE